MSKGKKSKAERLNPDPASLPTLSVIDTPEHRETVRKLFEEEKQLAIKNAHRCVQFVNASAVEMRPVSWLWPGWLARGKLHILAGAPGTGKTTIALDFAASVSAGKAFPTGHVPPAGRVLIWSAEDDWADTLAPRLAAAGANLSNVEFIGDVTEPDGDAHNFDPSRDVVMLRTRCAVEENVSLIIVDPIVMAVLGDSNKNVDVRRGLEPIVSLAAQLNAALIGITHFSKGTQGRNPLERVTGSVGYGGLARMVWGTARIDAEDGDEPELLFARVKSNIGIDGGGFKYRIAQHELTDIAGLSTTKIQWGNSVIGRPHELFADEEDGGSESDAVSFLRLQLESGPQLAQDVLREAARAGYSKDQMQRAKRRLRVAVSKTGMGSGWLWRLPGSDSPEGSEEGERF